MDIARLSVTSLAAAALVIAVTASGCSKSEEKSETSTSSAASSTTSAEATSSEESAPPETSAPAEPTDFGTLLIPAADMGADTQTPGGIQLNPGGNPGAAQVYASPDGKQQIIDTILVFPDVAAADSNFKSNSATMNQVTTGAPEPVEVGDQGVMAIGTSPDGTKSVTAVLFSQGRALVSLNFEGAPDDAVPPDVAKDIATKQATLIADGLPEE
jgi:hypothetical protein